MNSKPSLPTRDQVAMLPRTLEATIPADYLDEMGHMNVMWYTYLYSRAARGLLESVGIDQQYIDERSAGTFALEKHIRYLTEVRVGEHISVYTRVVGRVGSRFHVVQFLVNDTRERLASIMETVSVHVDLAVRRSAPMPPEVAEKLDKLSREHQSLEWPAPLCGAMSIAN